MSLLVAISKIFECLIHKRFFDFIAKHKLLYKYQFAFQPSLSTEHATIFLQKLVSECLENNEYGIGIFLDLQKAFDTLDHDILLKKLEIYGVRGNALALMKSYIKGRKQFVSYKNVSSSQLSITCGVPQGSILGPLLFLLYINDFYRVTDQLITIQFADDTNLFKSHPSLETLTEIINSELGKVSKWIRSNRLSLHIADTKTNYIIFTAINKPINCEVSITVDNTTLTQVKHTKFVGVIFDEHLSFRPHIETINNKLAKSVGIINRVKYYLPKQVLMTLYFSLV